MSQEKISAKVLYAILQQGSFPFAGWLGKPL